MKNNKGQTLVEYILIIALMSILIISLVKYFGGYIKDGITKTGCNISGEEYKKGKKPGQGTCESKDINEVLNKDEDEDNKEDE